ncbi:MAG: flagellar biosynthesis protein FlhA [Betaproteobacteria bacterium]|nr:flagellar biosynthesis protein FlhA [Betaproteobacteria bacterium]
MSTSAATALARPSALALAGPLLIVMILGMMILPLPPLLLDLLFTFNIALAMIVLLVSLYTVKPLDFGVFPTVLLLTTLLRLSLNVASTRVVLLQGHTGPAAAGKVIEAFGHFLVGGNFAVGLVVFAILVVINFVVITKGAGRIAEVSARFTLDAMPGKQMAIDADLNAGLIAEDEARRRRSEIAHEAEFYGSMDGASKFVRGDAVAGILILFINVIGGLAIGVIQHGMSFSAATSNYVLLAVGDGLVAQIPALVISTAAGLVVSRVGTGGDIGQQILAQLFSQARPLYLTAGVIGALGLIPGMPHLAFLVLALALGAAARTIEQRQASPAEPVSPEPAPPVAQEATEASWEDLLPVDVLGLEVGYRVIPLVDNSQGGELLARIRSLRRKFAQDIGFLPPSVHIRDNLELKPAAYRITLKGVTIGQGEVVSGQFLAIDPGRVTGTLAGTQTKDPAFGLPAVWIDGAAREHAQLQGYTVVDASTVVATHLSNLIHVHAAALLGRQETQSLLDHYAKQAPKLVEDLVPKVLSLGSLQRVLQYLLEEGVPIRDLRTILETLAEHGARTQDAAELTAAVRVALGRAIAQQVFGDASEIDVMSLDADLERVLQQGLFAGGDSAGLEPGLTDEILRQCRASTERQELLGRPAALLVPDRLRMPLARLARRSVPSLRVLALSEIPESRMVRVSNVVGGRS